MLNEEMQGDAEAPALSVRKLILPAAAEAASIVTKDSLFSVPDVISALYGWMGSNGYMSAGSHREIHLFGRELEVFHGLTSDPALDDRLVYEVLVPIERF